MALEIEESEDGEEGVIVRSTPSRSRSRKKKEDGEETPVENEEPIPLFPNIDKNKDAIVSTIRVYKRDPPGDGYKGDIHPSASLDFVAKRWGNGIYDFHALNAEHKILRRNDNIVISSMPKAQAPASEANGGNVFSLLDRQAQAHERDQARADGLAREALSSTRQQSMSYAEMVRADTEARMQRDREHYATMAAQQRESFQQMFLQTQQMHQMTMEQQRSSFSQVLQLMTATHEREMATNNPAVMLEVLQRGFAMASELGGGDQDPLSVAMQTGLGGLRELTKMMALQKGIKSPKLAKSNPTAKPQSAPKTGEKDKSAISRDELKEILELKKVAEAKGYDFEGILSQAKTMVAAAPDQNDESDEPDDSDDSEESGNSQVDRGNPPQ